MKPGEHKTVQVRILAYAQEAGWAFVPRIEAEARRGKTEDGDKAPPSLFFDDLLNAKVREFNPRYAEAEGALLGQFRHLLIQGAQAVLRMGRHTVLGQWGWKLFARKGNRNVAVAAIARKLLVQVWHMLAGNPPNALESAKSFTLKLHKLAVVLGTSLRSKLNLGSSLAACVQTLRQRALASLTAGNLIRHDEPV